MTNDFSTIVSSSARKNSAANQASASSVRRTPPQSSNRGQQARVHNSAIAADSHARQRDLERRRASRRPDMSRPISKQGRSIGEYGGTLTRQKYRAVPIVGVAEEPRVKTIKAAASTPLPISTIFMIVICGMLFSLVVMLYVQINEYTTDIYKKSATLSRLVTTERELTLRLDQRYDLSDIDKMASDTFGMVKQDLVSREYITLINEDKIENPSETESPSGNMGIIERILSLFR